MSNLFVKDFKSSILVRNRVAGNSVKIRCGSVKTLLGLRSAPGRVNDTFRSTSLQLSRVENFVLH